MLMWYAECAVGFRNFLAMKRVPVIVLGCNYIVKIVGCSMKKKHKDINKKGEEIISLKN